MGCFIKGLFLGFSSFRREDGSTRYAVDVACGRSAYRVFLSGAVLETLSSLSVGDLIELSARPYVNQKGGLAWADGAFI